MSSSDDERPLAEQPLAEQPLAEQPLAEQPLAERPLAEQPLAEQPLAEQPLAELKSIEAHIDELLSQVVEVPSIDLTNLLSDFVNLYKGMRQRDANWYATMGVTVGGSEIAALMGRNPYSTFFDVVGNKLVTLMGGTTWTGGGEACWWGTLFEDVIGAYVSIDLGSQIQGDDICIQELPGHRNSPDGYIVAKFYRAANDRLCLWTTDMSTKIPTISKLLLLEFKCPMSRKPTGTVPKQYTPQVWSGLMVSPVAHLGLFVDAVFRKCGLLDLGDTPEYDTKYHRFDRGAWEYPVAWGLIGVYAPRADAPLHVRMGWRGEEWVPGDPDPEAQDADASQAAWQIHSAYFGMHMKDKDLANDIVDLGDMDPRLFGRTLGLIDRKRFPVTRLTPYFVDGRGEELHICRAIEKLRAEAPNNHWLLGVLPWKLFEVNYIPVDRQLGFVDEVMPLIRKVHETVAAALASGNPLAYLKAEAQKINGQSANERELAISEEDLQDLFDSVSK